MKLTILGAALSVGVLVVGGAYTVGKAVDRVEHTEKSQTEMKDDLKEIGKKMDAIVLNHHGRLAALEAQKKR